MNQDILHDEFLDTAGKVLPEAVIQEIKEEDIREGGKLSGAWDALKKGCGKLQTGIVNVLQSDIYQDYADTAKSVAMDTVEMKTAEVLQRTFWALVEKHLGHFNHKVVRFFTKNPYGQALVLSIVAVPVSGLFKSRIPYYTERGDMKKAKLCYFFSRVTMKMAFSKGMDVFNVDGLINRGMDMFFGMFGREDINLDSAVADIPDDAVKAESNKRVMPKRK